MSNSYYINPETYINAENYGYIVHKKIDEGGNCIVYLVTQTKGKFRGNTFAMKLFKNINKELRRDRFEGQIKFIKEADHPSITSYYDEGVHEGYPFLVSEYLPNTLRDIFYKENVSLTTKISYAVQILSVLRYLENEDPPIVHRDIKPDNIFVRKSNCFLGDFGLIKRIGEKDVQEGKPLSHSDDVAMNKYRYRTPDLVEYERGNIDDVPVESDVFQLGLVLIELFTENNWNPQFPSDKPLSDVEIDKNAYKYIHIKEGMGRGIGNLLTQMINLDFRERKKASEIMNSWMGIFRDATKMSYRITGEVF